ncbi:hypothetical protein CAEBREN_21184 [Caenorhabditis brenneri]|uniref:DUF7869 domain-containing protein n=1 Tax=Caenorhabditis brenneri TaxID=135651 RepID=G0PFA0_CAEBE|nr:hypothetical protein CAEBREN_21184 [Caenorhabditis brenneri]
MFHTRLNSSLKKTNIFLENLCEKWPTCPMLFARTFGVSLSVLMNSFTDPTLGKYKNRGWYQKSVELLSESLKVVSKHVQIDSLNEVLVLPALSTQLPLKGSRPIPITEIRKKMDVQIRQRKHDTLVRCSCCFGLKEIMNQSVSIKDRKEAKEKLDLHYSYIKLSSFLKTSSVRFFSKQRTIIKALCSQSREETFDVNVMMVDGMSNRHTKLPQFVDQPKFVNDALRLSYSLTTVQIATVNGTSYSKFPIINYSSSGPYSFANFDYPSLQSVFSHDSSYVLSLILSGLSKLEAIPSLLVLILDSAANNKSNVIFGGLGLILHKVTALKKIYIIYPSTGHTHLSVDGHFGNLSQSIREVNLYDPNDFASFLESSPTVAGVDRTPTIFDFSPIHENMMRIGNLSSNSQYCLSKGQKDEILWSVAPSLHSSILYGAEKNEAAFPLFQEDFQPSMFTAKIRKPNVEAINKKIGQLIHHTGNLLTNDHRENYRKAVNFYGKQSFRQVISDLNQKRRKTIAFDSEFDDNGEDPHITVLNYLEKHGYPTGRIPKPP